MDSPAPLSTFSLTWCTATASTCFQVKAQQIGGWQQNTSIFASFTRKLPPVPAASPPLHTTSFWGCYQKPWECTSPMFQQPLHQHNKGLFSSGILWDNRCSQDEGASEWGRKEMEGCVGGWRKWRLRSRRCRSSCLPWKTPFFPIQQHDASRKHRSRCQGTSPNVFILPSLLRYPLTSHFSSLHLSPYIVNGDNHNTCTLKLKNICENHIKIFYKVQPGIKVQPLFSLYDCSG